MSFKVLQQFDLINHNSFGIKSVAERFVSVQSFLQLQAFLSERSQHNPLLILGGGSNLVLREYIPGDVLHVNISGVDVLEDNNDSVIVRAAAGEVWDEFVARCLRQKWYGLENLSLIPGTVGASPIQNIGAYGVEVEQFIYSVEAVEISSGQLKTFTPKECCFGYRDSAFKGELKDKWIITAVSFLLNKIDRPCLSYGELRSRAEKSKGVVTAAQLRDWVIEIRQSKLPDPAKIGNAGSFFKNCIVSQDQFLKLKESYPTIPSFPVSGASDNLVKVPSAWLIDQLGWKGRQFSTVGVHEHQALVLVNLGDASGHDVLELAAQIQQNVLDTYGLELEMEPTVVGCSEAPN